MEWITERLFHPHSACRSITHNIMTCHRVCIYSLCSFFVLQCKKVTDLLIKTISFITGPRGHSKTCKCFFSFNQNSTCLKSERTSLGSSVGHTEAWAGLACVVGGWGTGGAEASSLKMMNGCLHH